MHLSPGALIAQSPLVQKIQQENTIILSSIKPQAVCGAAAWTAFSEEDGNAGLSGRRPGRIPQHAPWASRRPRPLALRSVQSAAIPEDVTGASSKDYILWVIFN